MILQALTSYYETLAEKGEISKPGWGVVAVDFALEVNDSGEIIALYSLKTETLKKNKVEYRARPMKVPVQPGRSGKTPPSYFLCDYATYVLGCEYAVNPQKGTSYFQSCATLHRKLLSNVESPAAQAIIKFFENWNPSDGTSHPILNPHWDEVVDKSRIVFMYNSCFVLEDMQICSAWETHYNNDSDTINHTTMPCLVTGKTSSIPLTHPKIKGVDPKQTMGGALISFNTDNCPAFSSFNREQNLNAPVGHYAAFAYTTALNYLLADRNHCKAIGDTTIVCWAETGDTAYQDVAMMGMMGQTPQEEMEGDLIRTISLLGEGRPAQWEETELSPDTTFYILGLAPNAARISVRFFLRDSFGQFLRNVQAHHKRLEIVRPSFDKYETIPLWHLLQETVRSASKQKSFDNKEKPQPKLVGDVLRAILENRRYPATLLNGVTLRIRAEHTITRGRAAIIKAYYLQNPHPHCPKEVLTMSLNESSTNIPYTLGRLFSVLEALQEKANPGINTTIKDKYFNSASATPAVIFPVLINLGQKHLRKLDTGFKVYYDKQMQALLSNLDESYPQRLSLPEQGAFQLGYYHQTQKRYEKKEEK